MYIYISILLTIVYMQEHPLVESPQLLSRRKILALGSIGIASTIAGCSGSDDDGEAAADEGDVENSDGSEGTEETGSGTENDERDGIEAGESYSFEGSGSDVSDEFELTEGMATIEFTHSGESNFIATMVAIEGEDWDDELLVNVIGSIEGRSVLAVSGGAYQLDVDLTETGQSISSNLPSRKGMRKAHRPSTRVKAWTTSDLLRSMGYTK